MVLKLYADRPPAGRCLLLAHAVCEVTRQSEGIQIAIGLFAHQYRAQNPVCIKVERPDAVEALLAICVEFGIIVAEVLDS